MQLYRKSQRQKKYFLAQVLRTKSKHQRVFEQSSRLVSKHNLSNLIFLAHSPPALRRITPSQVQIIQGCCSLLSWTNFPVQFIYNKHSHFVLCPMVIHTLMHLYTFCSQIIIIIIIITFIIATAITASVNNVTRKLGGGQEMALVSKRQGSYSTQSAFSRLIHNHSWVEWSNCRPQGQMQSAGILCVRACVVWPAFINKNYINIIINYFYK